MKKITMILMSLLLATYSFSGIEKIRPTTREAHSFAIIVDQETYEKTTPAIEAYRNAIEQDGLACYILVAEAATPEEIRKSIKKIYKQEEYFEGIALVGDIPVPMIQDAQHLSSAFKMDTERFSLNRSSIASDRFYDDFDLEFKFLEQDTSDATLYYYSLLPSGAQRIEKEIYSARIKPHVSDESKYELLERYLNRVAEQKNKTHKIEHMLTFAGHGYHSEALAAWEWDLLSLREHFPQLYHAGNSIKNLNHASADNMKEIILTELQNPDLDIALFHAHGSDDTQYLNGYPMARNTKENVRDIKLYLRSKLRQAKRWKRDPEEYKEHFKEQLGVPDDWFAGAFVDSVMKADSLYGAALDIYTVDMEGIKTQPKFVMFDQCYNGQFTKSPYVAGKYVFSGGNTMVTVANTVNVKQDIWANEFLGMINAGGRVGEWHKKRVFLESHLIGDPTFHFNELPSELVSNLYSSRSSRYWKKQLESENPAFRSIAVRKLFNEYQEKYIYDLAAIYETDPSFNVRLQALRCLAETRSNKFEEILFKSAQDPAEMIRRISALWMGKVGHTEYLPVLAEMILYDHSERTARQAKESMDFIDPDKALVVFQQAVEKMPKGADKESLLSKYERSFNITHRRLYEDLIGVIQSDTMSVKDKKGAVRTFRNYSYHIAVDTLCDLLMDNGADLQLRINTAETLGWFTFSIRRDEILLTLQKVLDQKGLDDKLIAEVRKTQKRLMAGSNDPLVP